MFDAMPELPVSPVLRHLMDVRAILSDPDRWSKNGRGSPSGQHCLLQTVRLAISVERRFSVRTVLLLRMIHRLLTVLPPQYHGLARYHPVSLMTFNDTWTTEHADLMALLDRAIAKSAVHA